MIAVPEKLMHWQINPSKYKTNTVEWQRLAGMLHSTGFIPKFLEDTNDIEYMIGFGVVLTNDIWLRDTCLDNN